MIEEGFVQMYARDFITLASKAELGVEVEAAVQKRIVEVRTHATLMDARKTEGHLAAVVERLKLESGRDASHMRHGSDPVATAERRQVFLNRVAGLLTVEPEAARESLKTAPVRA